ncbi:LacI family transcriptional regulator [Flavobacteriaceae bacterium]|nr:LacI family transcriptional regulator [Flavobacteriaceae bacterium]
MKFKVTLKTIAKEFGVSISTVSKALKDSPDIGLETREKIQAFAKMYNYKPNSFALNLRNQKSQVIGVVVPELIHHFFSEVISGIEEEANKRGYNVMICLSDESFEKEKANLEMLMNANVDGVVMSIAKESLRSGKLAHINQIIQDEVPLVLFDRVHKALHCDKVVGDDVGGGFLATHHLLEEGRKHIAMITTPDHLKIGNDRKKGFLKALKQYQQNPSLIVEVDEQEEIEGQIAQVYESEILPDAVFAVNEVYAVVAMKLALKKGLKVPKDISLIGYTNGVISKYSTPSLSSVVQNGFLMGKESGAMLLDRIETRGDNMSAEQKLIQADIVFRESTQ